MSDEVIQNMRARVAQCRRLAGLIMDGDATQALLKMALQIEADILELEAEREARPKPAPPQDQ
jgi:hypothetical protein